VHVEDWHSLLKEGIVRNAITKSKNANYRAWALGQSQEKRGVGLAATSANFQHLNREPATQRQKSYTDHRYGGGSQTLFLPFLLEQETSIILLWKKKEGGEERGENNRADTDWRFTRQGCRGI